MKKQKISITKEVYDQLCQTIGRHPAEMGGILGSSNGGEIIDHYYFDFSAHTTSGTYTPNIAILNRVISTWNDKGVELVGFIHSHPAGSTKPSEGDFRYVKEIMRALDVRGKFFMPIINVNSSANGQIKIYSYAFENRLHMLNQPVSVIKNYMTNNQNNEHLVQLDCISKERFDRISTLYPLEALQRKTVVCIGLGGSRAFVEDLARSGVGNFVLIDGDVIAATNIATQQVYASEIGRCKADVVKERLLEINPKANVTVVSRFLDDSMSDKEFASIVGKTLQESPKDVLICGCTDNFYAQARSAALALKFGTPYLAAQLYQNGVAAEIYFSYPNVTNSSCPRCAMASRYEAYRKGYKNDVTSDGAPIFASTRVNSTKGQIAMMLLLYGEDSTCVYSNMLDQIADRNFVMIRMSPLVSEVLGINVFDEALSKESELFFFDEAMWFPQTPNDGTNRYPPCSLCKGTGDLLALKGKIKDTRTDW